MLESITLIKCPIWDSPCVETEDEEEEADEGMDMDEAYVTQGEVEDEEEEGDEEERPSHAAGSRAAMPVFVAQGLLAPCARVYALALPPPSPGARS